MGTVILVIGCIAGGMLFSNHQDVTHDETWKMMIGTVGELYSEKSHSRGGGSHTVYYAYVEDCNQKIAISEMDYDLLEEGDEVYVVLDHEENAVHLWRMERYTYVGERLVDGGK